MLTSLGKFLRKLRIDIGETLRDMADKLSVSSAFLSAVENGKKKMPESWFAKIESMYNLTSEQMDEFRKAELESRESIELHIQGIPAQNRDLAIAFARSFDALDAETARKIKLLLNKSDSEE